MSNQFSRRDVLKLTAASGLATSLGAQPAQAAQRLFGNHAGWITGKMTGAAALTEALRQEGCNIVFGIPGAQENELWDTFKSLQLPYHLVTHEFSAAAAADGFARSTGRPGVICVVPGPGVTNTLTVLGEALLDSVPIVCIVGDVARGERYRPFQIHSLPNVCLMQNVCKQVMDVHTVSAIPLAIRQAFQCACAGEPGPVAVVVPYNLLIESHLFSCGPLAPAPIPVDDANFQRALPLLCDQRLRIGIYAGLGCMDHSPALVRVAEMLQAPVATSLSGKGVIPEDHPLAVGWGYGAQGTCAAEQVFKNVDVVLAIGVRFSEVSTGFYGLPQHRHLIHVDINPDNLGRIMRTQVCINEDAGYFLNRLLQCTPPLNRPGNQRLVDFICARKTADFRKHHEICASACCDPMAFILALRRCSDPDAMVFLDATVSQFWAGEAFTATGPRTWFIPTDNQAMGWSIGAAIGGQRAFPFRQSLTITGDGCFLMSAMEISTAARECLPVKFFVLDDQAYQFMQKLQCPAYQRTTATILARLNYRALAEGFGVGYQEITCNGDLEPCIRGALMHPGPVLTRVVVDYRNRPIRWVSAVRDRYSQELTNEQKIRFAARIGSRAIDPRPPAND
jgi:acetolactate synthase I/II/III large subunit